MVGGIVLLAVIATTIWVGIDGQQLGVRRGGLPGSSLDMSVASWVICCLLLWIVAFPCYLVARGKYVAMRSNQPYGAQPGSPYAPTPYGAAPGYAAPGYPPAAVGQPAPFPGQGPPAGPPQMSPDGRWWWNGAQWVQVQAAPPPPPPQW